jgi:hypothetical protein
MDFYSVCKNCGEITEVLRSPLIPIHVHHLEFFFCQYCSDPLFALKYEALYCDKDGNILNDY